MGRTFRIKEPWFHLIAWICIFTFPVIVTIDSAQELNPLVLLRFLAGPVVFYINYLVLTPRLLLKRQLFLYLLASVLTLVLINYILLALIPTLDIRQFSRFDEVTSDIPQLRAMKYFIPAIISLSFYLLGGMVRILKDFYKRDQISKEREVNRSNAELNFLKAQLNPHFLFNSLNSIYSLVRNKSNDAPEAVITLSELMRYMLYEANQEKVSLKKEVEYIKNYVTLQRMRLLNSENVHLNINGAFENKKIYPLLLITYIENAFKYGTNFKGITDVNIKIRIEDDQLKFYVRNILGAYKSSKDNSGIGLQNIKNQLDLLYPESHLLKIWEDNEYYHVKLDLNLSA